MNNSMTPSRLALKSVSRNILHYGFCIHSFQNAHSVFSQTFVLADYIKIHQTRIAQLRNGLPVLILTPVVVVRYEVNEFLKSYVLACF